MEDMFPEIWAYLNPFQERGSYKKEFKQTWKFPTDNNFEPYLIADERTSCQLIIKCASLYTRRFAKTVGYIFIIEVDQEQIQISSSMSKPALTFQWRYDVNTVIDDHKGKEMVQILG